VLGDCLRSFAIARFSWAFYLTQQAGMRINPSLAASLRATSNGAFAGAIPEVCARIEAGDDLTTALTATQLFTEDFLQMVQVGETSGTVPEMLERLSPQFEDQARRSLAALAAALGWLVWLIVAGFIIFIIFRVFSWYMGLLNDALKGI
jgi:type IV pilus assembly protein PilC